MITLDTVDSTENVMLVTDGYDTEDFDSEGWTKVHANLLIADPRTLRNSHSG